MDAKPTVPNPGSAEALKSGCTCPVMDNHYGQGFGPNDDPHFYITGGCPLHWVGDTKT